MNPSSRASAFSVIASLLLVLLVGCEDREYADVDAPTPGSTIAASGLFTVTITFTAPPTAASYVSLELGNVDQAFVDIAPLLFPPGQSDFVGATTVSANIDAGALGLTPGALRIRTRYSLNGIDGTGTRLVQFNWVNDSTCEAGVSEALRQCFLSVSEATRLCYLNTGAACDPADFVADENLLRTSITVACAGTTPSAVGYGAMLDTDALADRLMEECMGNSASLAARFFGGPQGAVLAQGLDVPCLDAAYSASAAFIEAAFTAQSDCVVDEAACDPAIVATDIALARSTQAAAIDTACIFQTFDLLDLRVGLTTSQALDRAEAQSECMTSASHGDTAPLTLLCAPGSLEGVIIVGTDPPGLEPLGPAVPTQVMLDEAVWGTRCGDGSPYYFWIEMPPAGQPATNIHMYANGGGACFTDDCLGVPASLFRSSDDGYQTSGILNHDGTESPSSVDPFTAWTKANFPYCTQDLHGGGGATQLTGGTLNVERYGGVNIRAAMQVLRNLVAEKANAESPEGYRPDKLRVVFSGTSAGGFGVGFNIHYVLDDLRWADTTFLNGAGSNVNPGLASVLGVLALGSWAVDAMIPPYCLDANCFVPATTLYAAHSARLLATPAQQFLVAHNQIDNTQRNTQLFADTPSHVNALRQAYCDVKGLPGVSWFMGADAASLHPLFASDSIDSNLTAGGMILQDWAHMGIFDPTNIADEVDEGILVTAYPGVQPFPCTLD